MDDLYIQAWTEGYYQALMQEAESDTRVALALGRGATAWSNAFCAVRYREKYEAARDAAKRILDGAALGVQS